MYFFFSSTSCSKNSWVLAIISSWIFSGTPWLTIWKNPHDSDASLISSTVFFLFTGSWTAARSMVGKM
ncbi:hypothetical protein LINPERHAP2_LOCUS18332 [Linum perenne]